MQWIIGIAKELLGLFVDDGYFAIAIVVWLGVVWFLSLHILEGNGWSGAVLFAGLGLILLRSAIVRARQ
jgi:hypothetical protein